MDVLSEMDAERGELMESIRNSLDRFKIWIVSIREMYKTDLDEWHDSREQPFKSGIREDLSNEVLRLLDQLQELLQDLIQILNGTRQQRTWVKSSISDPPSDMDISSSEDSDSEFANYLKQNSSKEDSANSQTVTESGELCQSINDIITSLMRIAMQVDNSLLNSKFDRCRLEESDPVELEIMRVREKLPRVRRNEPLARKLGRANAQRRKWLQSRRSRHDVISDMYFRFFGLSARTTDASHRKDPSSFTAKVTARFDHAREAGMDHEDAEERTMASEKIVGWSSSKEEDGKEPESTAKRTKGPFDFLFLMRSGNFLLRWRNNICDFLILMGLLSDPRWSLPLFPKTRSNLPYTYDTLVRCPYCHIKVVMSNYDEWQMHVFADLSSYICTFEGCPAPLFETRQQWFQHEMEVHRKNWRCDMCEEFYHSLWDMKRHLTQKHSDIIGAGNAEAHAERLGRPPQKIRAKDCPLCDPNWNLQQPSRWLTGDWEMTAEAFGDHLGKHLEDLSLLVLPPTTDMKLVFRGTGDISNLTAPIGETRSQPKRIINALRNFWWETYLTFIMALFLSVRNSPYSFLHS
ncbi:hypothetical protein GE21DRAFT_6575 [Neurospora crassa]|uniref:C2H2-type domain-containing protein n=1 Tax=Neurospora crassa (strain ATCC 24698 / 74-OR23-1A / CBS 708.71 / DSM 1257 / FGSC 987) TaxID=367110 RepID=Q7S8F7_NEUCR|nr:hypothetical protein NCU08813 [Neurospora crassa OR74A]EAA32617.3 hypothetical protein NCU08813 [Neurospora crassa OR74A]KHE78792.1 hypothetical protein GE21DRAFT_6575 [Neurospora crassa]|eukprot:XP_961853.3 hypothetical protein NCU08813 [Neurospora crassa OR74A]